MTVLIPVPDELIEQIKIHGATTQAEIEKFVADAARKSLAQYGSARPKRTPREIYVETLAQVTAFEQKYNLPTAQFLPDFEAGKINEDAADWLAFYEWRSLGYALRRLEEKYGFVRNIAQ